MDARIAIALSGGANISSREVADALYCRPAVLACAVRRAAVPESREQLLPGSVQEWLPEGRLAARFINGGDAE